MHDESMKHTTGLHCIAQAYTAASLRRVNQPVLA